MVYPAMPGSEQKNKNYIGSSSATPGKITVVTGLRKNGVQSKEPLI